MNTWKSLAFGIVLGLLLSGAILLIVLPPRGQPLTLSGPPTPSAITVFVTGAVKNPGVHTLPRLSRVNDAVSAAGGFLRMADQTAVNLAAQLEDGAQIFIPTIAETTAEAGTAANNKKILQTTSTVNFPVNINSASISLLQELPGIGVTKAEAIISYRQEHGPFSKIGDIMDVPGIGSGIFAQLKDLITVTDGASDN